MHHWPGVNGLTPLLAGRPLRATRPLHFFRPDGPMPDTVELRLTIPPGLGPETDVLAELRERVAMVEAQGAAERQRTGRRVCGRRAVLAQSWRCQPVNREPRRNLRPRVAAPNKWARIEALLRNRTFVREYMAARQQWREGVQVVLLPAAVGSYFRARFRPGPGDMHLP